MTTVFQPWKHLRFAETDFDEPDFDNLSFSPNGRYGLYVSDKNRCHGQQMTLWGFRVIDLLESEMYRYSSEINGPLQSFVTSYWVSETTVIFVSCHLEKGVLYQHLCSIDHCLREVFGIRTFTYPLRGNLLAGINANAHDGAVPKCTSGSPLRNQRQKYILISCATEMKVLHYDPSSLPVDNTVISSASIYVRPWAMNRNEDDVAQTCHICVRPICRNSKIYLPLYTYYVDRTPRRRTMADHFICFNLQNMNIGQQSVIMLDNNRSDLFSYQTVQMKLFGGQIAIDYVGDEIGITFNEQYAVLYEKPKSKQVNIYLQTKKMIVVNLATKQYYPIKTNFETSSFPTIYRDKVLLWADNGSAKFRYFDLSPKPPLTSVPKLFSLCQHAVMYDRAKRIPDEWESILFPPRKKNSDV